MVNFNKDIPYSKVIFVSEDDTYRGPVAAALMKQKLPRGVPEVESRGLVVLFNEPPNMKGARILSDMGIDIENHSSKQLQGEDFSDTTLIVLMAERSKKMIYERFNNATNVFTLRELSGEEGDVDIPYGKGIEEYKENVMYIKGLVDNLAELMIMR